MALRRSEEREGPMRGLSKPKHFQNSLHLPALHDASLRVQGAPFWNADVGSLRLLPRSLDPTDRLFQKAGRAWYPLLPSPELSLPSLTRNLGNWVPS